MSNLADYQSKLEAIAAIPADQIVTNITIPVKVYVQEAEKLYRWCQDDKAALTARGLDWELVEDLPVRTGALVEAQSRWTAKRFSRKHAEEKWAREYPEAYQLRNTILHEFRYAYRDNQFLKDRVKEIGQGRGHADMILDLNSLAVLGRENPDYLTAIYFDMSLLGRAAQMAVEKSALWGEARSDRAMYKESKKIRDQAYTYLKQAVDKICKHAQFVLWQNEARLKGYRSDYLYKKNYKQRNKPKEKKKNTDANDSKDTKNQLEDHNA